jgi:hypothetical protein
LTDVELGECPREELRSPWEALRSRINRTATYSLASHDLPEIIGLDPQGLVRRLPKALEILLGQGACFLEQGCLGVDEISRPLNRMIHRRSELRRIREVLRFKVLEAS